MGTKDVYCSLGASTPTESAQLITAHEHVHGSKQRMDMPARLQGANMLEESTGFFTTKEMFANQADLSGRCATTNFSAKFDFGNGGK